MLILQSAIAPGPTSKPLRYVNNSHLRPILTRQKCYTCTPKCAMQHWSRSGLIATGYRRELSVSNGACTMRLVLHQFSDEALIKP
jgi:hypothetical protein